MHHWLARLTVIKIEGYWKGVGYEEYPIPIPNQLTDEGDFAEHYVRKYKVKPSIDFLKFIKYYK